MNTYDLFMVADISVLLMAFIGILIWRYVTRPINLVFQGEKFHIDREDKNCVVISFEGGETFRKTGMNCIPENQYNLAEWTFAERGHKNWLQN